MHVDLRECLSMNRTCKPIAQFCCEVLHFNLLLDRKCIAYSYYYATRCPLNGEIYDTGCIAYALELNGSHAA